MGAEQSQVDYSASISIPASLRPVYPFLYDANRFLKSIKKDAKSGSNKKRLALSCINHSFKLLLILNLDFDAEAKECLMKFHDIRTHLGKDLGITLEPLTDVLLLKQNEATQIPSHEILLAEADAMLNIADEMLTEGMRFDAMLNYHTACVFYRVLMSMIPALTPLVQPRLMYSTTRTRQTSPVQHNFVLEHFGDTTCTEVYEVHGSSKLGKGSYGSVYLATHRVTGDERAVKVMNVDRVTSYYLRKLHTEISVLRAIDHPNIVKLQDVFFGRRSVYLVTDLCRGGELFELLNSGKSQGFVFREDRASQLMRDMISAVHYLHEQGIVHRDLKLENFLFESKTASSPLVLIDFGLSRFFESDEKLNQRVGSCYYTAPEVLNGTYDNRCDNWSLGVLCYMLLSGTPPFYGKSVEEVYASTLSQEPVFVDKKFRHVSSCCIDFMQRLLVKDPEKRMTAGAALTHPFITGLLPPLSAVMPAANSSSPVTGSNIASTASGTSLTLTQTSSNGHVTSSLLSAVSNRVRSNSNPNADDAASATTTTQGSTSSGFSFGWNPFSSASSSSAVTVSSAVSSTTAVTVASSSGSLNTGNELNSNGLALARRFALPIEIATSVVESLKLFSEADPLIRLSLTMIAHTISPELTTEMRRVFQSIDSSHTGIISSKELNAALISYQAVASGAVDLELYILMTKLTAMGYQNSPDSSTVTSLSPSTLRHSVSTAVVSSVPASPVPTEVSSISTPTLKRSTSSSAIGTSLTNLRSSSLSVLSGSPSDSPVGVAQSNMSLSISKSAATSTYINQYSIANTFGMTYLNFMAAMIFNRIDISDERVQLVFNTLDPDKSGYISEDSMKKFLGGDVNDAGITYAIQTADWDGDGLITENDFMQKWRHFRRMFGRGPGALSDAPSSSSGGSPVQITSPPVSVPPLAPQTAHHRTSSGGKGIALAMKQASHQRQLSGSSSTRGRPVPAALSGTPYAYEPMDLT